MANISTLLLFIAAQAAVTINSSVQVLFDRAEEAASSGDWSGALAGYEALEQRLQTKGSTRSLAIVRVRKGEALSQLSRLEEAEVALVSGLQALPATDESLREERLLALLNLAEIAELTLRYPAAQVRYAEAERLTTQNGLRLRALTGLVRTGMFEDPQSAVANADRALAIVTAMPEATKPNVGRWRTLKGRALLNAGDFSAARKELNLAMRELGGLTYKVDQADIAARSDLAIAAMLSGNEEEARRYLAFTGAGRLKDDGLGTGVTLDPPECGGPAGLNPKDVAVVEFSILDDGSVDRVAPIYSSRKGAAALEFARAVLEWSWPPERVKTIDPFFRALTRLEMRCSTTTTRPSVTMILTPRVEAWMTENGIRSYVAPQGSHAARVAPARAELARREAAYGTHSLHLLPVLIDLAGNPVLTTDEALPLLMCADSIVRSNGSPPHVLAALAMQRAQLRDPKSGRSRWSILGHQADLLLVASRDPAIQGDAFALSSVRIAAADRLAGARRSHEGLPLLRQVVSDARLGQHDPLRVGALIRVAALEKAEGDLGAARAAFEQTGLSGSQCALVDARPALVRSNTSFADFPNEAARWGFEGWATTEFDITSEGRTSDVRSVLAYPPFIFSPAAREVSTRARYTQSYRPDGGLGCGGERVTIRFTLIDRM